MPLSVGLRLGPYEVQAPAGAGGMGEVYRALDTRLDRTVAIKVLPRELAANPESRQRLDREARSISKFSHPHICALFDIGHEGEVDFLVMEYLEGETLERRLERGPLPIAQALRHAIEIADALEKAHHLGVVHRDLKPGNIMLTKSGVKLLDFGLAKFKPEAAPIAIALTEMATETRKLTVEGMLVGTLQYMAPEQLEVEQADARTDIFAFGAVLYEMITGRPAFTGKSKASLIAAILSSEPPPIPSLQPLSPLAVDRIVKICLAKDPEDRWQTAHDVKLQLQGALEAASQPVATIPVVRPTKRIPALAWKLVAVLALLSVLATIVFFRLSGNKTNPVLAFILPPEKTTFEFMGDNAGPPVISPDDRFLVFVGGTEGKSRLWLRALDSENAQPLAATEGATFPFWSPDSHSIGFFADGKLKRIDINGGSLKTLCDSTFGRGGTWSTDGVIVFSPAFQSGLFRIPASGGTPVSITKVDLSQHTTHRWPSFLPDGKHFLYLAANHASPKSENTGIYVGSVAGEEGQLLLRSSDNAAYAAGYLFFMREDTLMAQRFNADGRKLVGDAVPIATNVLNDVDTWSAVFSVSERSLAYQAAALVGTQLIWLDRAGKQLGTLGGRERYSTIRISPHGDRVAVALGSPEDIWIYDVSRGVKTRLTFNPERDGAPVWSPDGSQIIFTSEKRGHPDLYRKAANGTGPQELLLESNLIKIAQDWSLDGRFVIYTEQIPGSFADLWVLPLFGDHKPFPLVQSPFPDYLASFSPDGHWVVYVSDESGAAQVYVIPFRAASQPNSSSSAGGKWQISNAGGTVPIWRRDGKELLYVDSQGRVISAEVTIKGSEFQVGKMTPLFKLPPNTGFDATADGQRFLIKALSEEYSAPITLLVNWQPKLGH